MNRRAIFTGIAATCASTAVPASVASVREEPHDRVHRLMEELADALPHVLNGSFRVIVQPDGMAWFERVGRRRS